MLLIIIWYFFIIIFGLGLGLIVLASASRFWPRLTSLTGISHQPRQPPVTGQRLEQQQTAKF